MSIFILFFFLSLDLVKSMAGERVGVNDVTRGGSWRVTSLCVCVQRGHKLLCIICEGT